jgi:hypothetical protein
LDKLFQKGKIEDVEQRKRFLARLRPKLKKICVIKTYTNIKEMVTTATEIKRVPRDLGETPYDPLREEKDEDAVGESFINKHLSVLNETLIQFFYGI